MKHNTTPPTAIDSIVSLINQRKFLTDLKIRVEASIGDYLNMPSDQVQGLSSSIRDLFRPHAEKPGFHYASTRSLVDRLTKRLEEQTRDLMMAILTAAPD